MAKPWDGAVEGIVPPPSCCGEGSRPPVGMGEHWGLCFQQERVNSKKQKVKEEKKLTKSSSRDRLSEETAHDSTTPSQEPIDPLIMEKYTQRLHTEVRGRPSSQNSPSSPVHASPISEEPQARGVGVRLHDCAAHLGCQVVGTVGKRWRPRARAGLRERLTLNKGAEEGGPGQLG